MPAMDLQRLYSAGDEQLEAVKTARRRAVDAFAAKLERWTSRAASSKVTKAAKTKLLREIASQHTEENLGFAQTRARQQHAMPGPSGLGVIAEEEERSGEDEAGSGAGSAGRSSRKSRREAGARAATGSAHKQGAREPSAGGAHDLDEAAVAKMTCPQLKEELKARGVEPRARAKKAELVEALVSALRAEAAAAPAGAEAEPASDDTRHSTESCPGADGDDGDAPAGDEGALAAGGDEAAAAAAEGGAAPAGARSAEKGSTGGSAAQAQRTADRPKFEGAPLRVAVAEEATPKAGLEGGGAGASAMVTRSASRSEGKKAAGGSRGGSEVATPAAGGERSQGTEGGTGRKRKSPDTADEKVGSAIAPPRQKPAAGPAAPAATVPRPATAAAGRQPLAPVRQDPNAPAKAPGTTKLPGGTQTAKERPAAPPPATKKPAALPATKVIGGAAEAPAAAPKPGGIMSTIAGMVGLTKGAETAAAPAAAAKPKPPVSAPQGTKAASQQAPPAHAAGGNKPGEEEFVCYALSPYRDASDDDDYDTRPKKAIPEWARGYNLKDSLWAQRKVDPDDIFCEFKNATCHLREVFDYSNWQQTAKNRHPDRRTSSQNWAQDRCTAAEILAYRNALGLH
ncbi:unnamed protein product [Pedinophyceae sp. YPF-701]|nr:unnamed protein product [Pedinophyceae sp. YPF-701]